MSMSKAHESSHEMSKADEFRKSTAEFWSRMDQKSKLVAERRKLTPASQVAVWQNVDARCGRSCQNQKAKQALIDVTRRHRGRCAPERAQHRFGQKLLVGCRFP